MLSTLLEQSLEQAINRWLTLDASTYGSASHELAALQGHLICLQLTEPTITLYFMPTAQGINVSRAYAAEPDVTVRGTARGLLKVSLADDPAEALLAAGIKLEGDSGLSMRFSQILRSVDIDWEELLSRWVGDGIAHQVGNNTRKTQGWLRESARSLQHNMQEYLQEEIRLTPAPTEISMYCDTVANLRLDVDRLEARLQRLETQYKQGK